MKLTSRRKTKSSGDSWCGTHTIQHDGSDYMTRIWFGRLRLHIFYRGDYDEDFHDHPWEFWTFPLTTYAEQYLVNEIELKDNDFKPKYQIVQRFKVHHRSTEHKHRVLGASTGKMSLQPNDDKTGFEMRPNVLKGNKIVTLVWVGKSKRNWGFWKHREGKWCWQFWKDYVTGGKSAPCD